MAKGTEPVRTPYQLVIYGAEVGYWLTPSSHFRSLDVKNGRASFISFLTKCAGVVGRQRTAVLRSHRDAVVSGDSFGCRPHPP